MITRHAYRPEIPPDLAAFFEQEGLHLVGIAPAEPAPREQAEYERWIAEGKHGSMGYLADHAPMKFHPESLLPGCRSVLVAALNYYQEANWTRGDNNAAPGSRPPRATPHAPSGDTSSGDAPPGHAPPGADTPSVHDSPEPAGPLSGGAAGEVRGRIARYAWGRDYHKVLGKRLRRIARRLAEEHPEHSFRHFTDSAPLAERYYAERAGVGFTARNTLSISGEFGSWFILGEILSTVEYPPTGDAGGRHGACPTNCTRCIDVCPTGALYAPHRIDASKCISYLTIEHKGSIPEDLRPKMGNWLFGCDLCQEVCPLNIRVQQTGVEDFVVLKAGDSLELSEILDIEDEDAYRERFAGSPLMRAKRRGLVRNACIVAANTGARDLLPRLRALCDEDDEIIAEHAAWAVSQLEKQSQEQG